MEQKDHKIKAIGLVSGGLDSMLATKLLMEQGIEVIPVNFNTGFCVTSVRRKTKQGKVPAKKLKNDALVTGEILGVPVQLIDISDRYMEEVVLHPKYGYGKAFNPCVDCRIYMLKKAKELMHKIGAHFVYTGEVLGQRPMSQHMNRLRTIEKESGLEGYLLRPLSAKL
jgi:tRNA U34 2-thiouridine synthase MnmA/TrmU